LPSFAGFTFHKDLSELDFVKPFRFPLFGFPSDIS
jgi:hypothetical protein